MITSKIITGDVNTTKISSQVGGNAVKKDDFLKMLVTQLQYQDPLKPMENTEFTTQLAQFSSLEQLTSINDALSQLKITSQIQDQGLAASLIGKTVEAEGSSVTDPVITGKVTEVQFDNNREPILIVGTNQVPLSKVSKIKEG